MTDTEYIRTISPASPLTAASLQLSGACVGFENFLTGKYGVVGSLNRKEKKPAFLCQLLFKTFLSQKKTSACNAKWMSRQERLLPPFLDVRPGLIYAGDL